MKVILLNDIDKLGKKLEVKEVAEGYARNYLIPNAMAKIADANSLEWAIGKRKELANEAEESLKKVGNLATKIDGMELEIPMKVGDHGQFFEKVNAQKIAKRLQEIGYDIKKSQIELKEDIEELGEYEATIKFEHNLETQIKLIVVEETQ